GGRPRAREEPAHQRPRGPALSGALRAGRRADGAARALAVDRVGGPLARARRPGLPELPRDAGRSGRPDALARRGPPPRRPGGPDRGSRGSESPGRRSLDPGRRAPRPGRAGPRRRLLLPRRPHAVARIPKPGETAGPLAAERE